MKPTQLQYALALQAVPNIGDITAKKLIQHCGSPEAVFKASSRALQSIDGICSVVTSALQHSKTLKAAEQELKFMQKHNIKAQYFEDDDYPFRLKHCIDGPIVLFQKGNIRWENSPVISILGTRKLTNCGKQQCEH